MKSVATKLRQIAARLEERRDIHNSPYLLGRKEPVSKTQALSILQKMYKDYKVWAEQIPEGLAYYVTFKLVGKTLIGNYHFERQQLNYRVYPGIKAPK
jgi:hypothetical protein